MCRYFPFFIKQLGHVRQINNIYINLDLFKEKERETNQNLLIFDFKMEQKKSKTSRKHY